MTKSDSGSVAIYRSNEEQWQESDADRIFVAIPCYRDTECQWTVQDLFLKASSPDRVFVGICWQIVPEEDSDCFILPSPRPEQTRTVTFHATKSEGVGWARYQVHKLWRGEPYVMNIDSHMRFAEGWDKRLLIQLKKCSAPKPVLSTYPSGYVPPNQLDLPSIPVLCASYFNKDGVLVNTARPVPPKCAPDVPIPSMLYAAGFSFSSSLLLEEVPYDPYIYFQGEEIAMATRMWTYGWDLFAPIETLIYHAYGKKLHRKTHMADNCDWLKRERMSRARVAHLIGSVRSNDDNTLKDMEAYGLGTARTLEDYQRLSGIHFVNRTIAFSAREGRFPYAPYDPIRVAMRRTFTEIWSNNTYGNTETRSGPGSTLKATKSLSTWLRKMLPSLGVNIMVDAGCGDAAWISQLVKILDIYIGIDIVDEQIDTNLRVHLGNPKMFFRAGDIVSDLLPKCDLILCRDTLTHLSDAVVGNALDNFRRSGATFLMATHFPQIAPRDIETGKWRPLNLENAPFSLGKPFEFLVESFDTGKTLSIWRLKAQ